MSDTKLRVFAPAKVNLCLHITGQRADGYHELNSLVAFADVGDWLEVSPNRSLKLTLDGPESEGLTGGDDNLVVQVARLFGTKAKINLTKNLPVASGIGGGSADAAAAFRAMKFLAGDDASVPEVSELGADIPMCIGSKTAIVSGIGHDITPADLPDLPVVLVNPRVGVSTPQVFRLLATKNNPPLGGIPNFEGIPQLVSWLGAQRNDLEVPAAQVCPEISQVLRSIRETDQCLLARMSGSGATCFGIFPTLDLAERAARILSEKNPEWWITPATLGSVPTGTIPS